MLSHCPLTQLSFAAQELLQLPQYCSLWRSTHWLPQQPCVPVQAAPLPHMHEPFWHVSPMAQAMPQPPQLVTSVATYLHDVVQHSAPEATSQALELPHLQLPLTQALDSSESQMLPQTPQLFVSDVVLLQVPLQQVSPEEHMLPQGSTHTPLMQLPSQKPPHSPQLFRSLCRSTQPCSKQQVRCGSAQVRSVSHTGAQVAWMASIPTQAKPSSGQGLPQSVSVHADMSNAQPTVQPSSPAA